MLSTIPSYRLRVRVRNGIDRLFPTYYALVGHRRFNRLNDVMIASYPKSGRTWLRTVLAKYFEEVTGSPATLDLAHRTSHAVPGVYFTHLLLRARYWRGRLVLLVRDPRDVVVSDYYYRTGKGQFSGSISEFVRGPHGMVTVVDYMNELMECTEHEPQRLVVSYEEMTQDTLNVVSRVLHLMCATVDEAALTTALDFSRFDNLQKLEREQQLPKRWFRTGRSDVSADGQKVRKGKVGNYVNELSPEDIEFADRVIADRLTPASAAAYAPGK